METARSGPDRRGTLEPDPELPAPSLPATLWSVAAVLGTVLYVAATALRA